ncbi:unnamed protein product [Photorhabdus laumondii subsp. laumondii TTO1]|uniref:Photorhabdus luminescens subsp. laumondii TTO1 complete genome segment 9/17 n=1 Tax=Photorhabdus laumondii subsp. laumondii (strain DSM 15139 / CIP 105565 / TT01) TaxID=243265 RepID=Q7N449_PHOLL|nr:unnamed protein product [Photorhabdus laumondii subsp. laumondii TTO1]
MLYSGSSFDVILAAVSSSGDFSKMMNHPSPATSKQTTYLLTTRSIRMENRKRLI